MADGPKNFWASHKLSSPFLPDYTKLPVTFWYFSTLNNNDMSKIFLILVLRYSMKVFKPKTRFCILDKNLQSRAVACLKNRKGIVSDSIWELSDNT